MNCLQIFSGNIPFHEMHLDYPVILKVIQGIRPSRPLHCAPSGDSCINLGLDDHLWGIAEECWLTDPAVRPTMSDIVIRLPQRPMSITQPDGIRQYYPDQDLIAWAISHRDARTHADESPINNIRGNSSSSLGDATDDSRAPVSIGYRFSKSRMGRTFPSSVDISLK